MLNSVVATQKSGSHTPISKSNSKLPSTAQKVGMPKGDGATDDEPVISGLQDKDKSLKQAATLMSPVKGLDSRKSTKVSLTCISLNFWLTQMST